ncbi:MAG: SAM hydrolase/SAM-dependent halogenase family protein [Bryobacteraceae bacterium]
MPSSILTLTTDFGHTDHFVGTMKGVILGIQRAARIVDLCHEVAAFDVAGAAFLISQAYPYFPPKTVHVVVVDPGVGTSRRPILVEAAGQYFIGPDNGVFAFVLSNEKHRVRHITAARYFRKAVSQTFHGRDVFAPAAAHLAKGVPAARFGKLIDDYLRPSSLKPERTARRGWTGQILRIDRFGNLITNFHIDEFQLVEQGPFEMQVGLQYVRKLAQSYGEGDIGEVFAIVGSSGMIEVSANQASAARILGCGVGAPVELRIF